MVVRDDFLLFAERQLITGGFDAVHPLFLEATRGWTKSDRAWLTMLYMTYYNDACAWYVFHRSDPWTVQQWPSLKIDTNRRCLRGGAHQEHLEHVCEVGWDTLISGFSDDRCDNWALLEHRLERIRWNGAWASYTTADMLGRLCGLPIDAPDIGTTGNPIDGFKYATGEEPDPWNCAELLSRVEQWAPAYMERCDMQALESICCDYWSWVKRRFYVGRSIDRQQRRIGDFEEEHDVDMGTLWKSRRRAFDERTLGELNGWYGIQKDRLGLYPRCPWRHA